MECSLGTFQFWYLVGAGAFMAGFGILIFGISRLTVSDKERR